MCVKLALLAILCFGGLVAHSIPLTRFKRAIEEAGNSKSSPDPISERSGLVDYELPTETKTVPTAKYFQDMYVAQNNPKELEFGHVAENLNEWEQRFEKINLDNLNRQGKVRWGDKNGGYGEHYWDFNHAGQGDDEEGKESQQNEESSEGGETQETLNSYQVLPREKRNPDDDVEFISDQAKSSILNDRTPKHGGNYRKAKEIRIKRQPQPINPAYLVFDVATGKITDQNTGTQYQLKEVQ
ncbi:uncharacterized protein LOC115881160 isoform X2 [Sitophilus oryzae]|uniref:Uncharacterized protein LOC115881160 isoform X2 n=1 Tax=Sitophilus oryzae TaxID=7048 RepID=A0A6J2XUY8_SITOR|nr:uncharacterized protein LOC115881160 isoform X2 [Sitophilus oryzae]